MAEEKRDSRSGGGNGARPPKVLSTTLGVVLAANLLTAPALHAEGADNQAGDHQPKLVEWSTDEVKNFYNPGIDWNIELPGDNAAAAGPGASPTPSPTPTSGAGAGSTGNTVIVNQSHGSGFGWDDILLYHFLFNNAGTYSTSTWSRAHPVTYTVSHQAYQPKSFASGTFENRPVEGSTVRPKTSASSGSFTSKASKSTSSSTGSIGGKSSSFSSSGKSSGSSFGS